MKVWQIVEAGENMVGTGVLGPDGKEIFRPEKPKPSPKPVKTPKPPSNPGVSTKDLKNPTTWGNSADYDIKTKGGGKVVEVKYTPKGGKQVVFRGRAKDVLKQMAESGDKGALRGLSRIGKSRGFFVKYAKSILRGTSFLGAGYVGYEAIADWAEERATIRQLLGETVFKGSNLDSNHPVYKAYMAYHTKAAAVNVGQLIATELGQWIAAGKIAKMLRYARALQVGLAATGWGAVIAVLIWALMEGSQWLIGWWLRKYGPDWFQASVIEELSKTEGDIIPSETAPKVSDSEVKKEVQKAANDSADKVEDPTEVFKKWKKIKANDDSGNLSVQFSTD